MVLLDRSPLALRCALLSARASLPPPPPAPGAPTGAAGPGPAGEGASHAPAPAAVSTPDGPPVGQPGGWWVAQEPEGLPEHPRPVGRHPLDFPVAGGDLGRFFPPAHPPSPEPLSPPAHAHAAGGGAGPGPGSAQQQQRAAGQRAGQRGRGRGRPAGPPAVRAAVFDWNSPASLDGERFDVLMACDVLYEDAAVGPISALLPK